MRVLFVAPFILVSPSKLRTVCSIFVNHWLLLLHDQFLNIVCRSLDFECFVAGSAHIIHCTAETETWCIQKRGPKFGFSTLIILGSCGVHYRNISWHNWMIHDLGFTMCVSNLVCWMFILLIYGSQYYNGAQPLCDQPTACWCPSILNAWFVDDDVFS